MKKTNPKVLIGVVTASQKDYCALDFIKQLKSFNYDNYEVYIVDNSESKDHTLIFKDFKVKHISRFTELSGVKKPSELLCECQNELRNYALENNFDYLFNLESDVFVSPNLIQLALSYEAPVYTATYPIKTRYNAPAPCVQYLHVLRGQGKAYSNTLMLPYELRLPAEVKQITDFKIGENMCLTHTGLGCTFIRRDVLKYVPFRTNEENDKKTGRESFSDTFFYIDCLTKKIEVLFDNRYICEHNKNW